MKRFILLILSLLSINAYAADMSEVVIAYGNDNVPVSSYLDVDATYVAMPVTLSSDAKSPAKRAELMNKLQSAIKTAVGKDPSLEFKQGEVSLSPEKKSSFSFYGSYGSSESDIYILGKLGEGNNIYHVTQKLYKFIASIEKPDDTSISPGKTALAVLSPDKYKEELLGKIKAEIKATKNIIGPGYKVSVSGLESPVFVRQKNDKQVTLFLNYQLVLSE